jgi:NOL1/NOP2/fmu family ribosome biogenesis protein
LKKAECDDIDDIEAEYEIPGKKKKKGAADARFWKDKAGIRVVRECLDEALRDFPIDYDRLILFGEQVYQLPEGLPSFDGLRVLRPGLHLGTLRKNRLEPSHALALALRPEQAGMSVDFSAEDPAVLNYLNGGTLSVDPKLKGYTLVTVDGYSLGWGKAAAGTLKNHYPKGLRISF